MEKLFFAGPLGHNKHNGLLIDVRFARSDGQQLTGWIAANLLDTNNELIVPALNSFLQERVGSTRMAIYQLLDVNDQVDLDTYANNFMPTPAVEPLLDRLAPYPRTDLTRVDK